MLKTKRPLRATRFVMWLNEELVTAETNRKTLAARSGLGQSTISQLASGVRSPSRATVAKIAAALDADLSSAMLAAGFVPDEPSSGTPDLEARNMSQPLLQLEIARTESTVAIANSSEPEEQPSLEKELPSLAKSPLRVGMAEKTSVSDVAYAQEAATANESGGEMESSREKLPMLLESMKSLSEELSAALQQELQYHQRIIARFDMLRSRLDAVDLQCTQLFKSME